MFQKLNLVSVIQATLFKVLDHVGLEKSVDTECTVVGSLLFIAGSMYRRLPEERQRDLDAMYAAWSRGDESEVASATTALEKYMPEPVPPKPGSAKTASGEPLIKIASS